MCFEGQKEGKKRKLDAGTKSGGDSTVKWLSFKGRLWLVFCPFLYFILVYVSQVFKCNEPILLS